MSLRQGTSETDFADSLRNCCFETGALNRGSQYHFRVHSFGNGEFLVQKFR